MKLREIDEDLLNASFNGNIDETKELLKKGANVNSCDENGNTPLLYAVASDDFDLVKLLVENKADLDLSNNCGETPLDVAQDRCFNKIKDYLLGMGAGYNGSLCRSM